MDFVVKTSVFLFFLFVCIGCNGKSPVATLPEPTNPNDTTLNLTTKTMEPIQTFNKKRYYENLDPNEGIEYIFTDSSGNTVRQFETHDLFVEEIQNPESLFMLKNGYDKETGMLKNTGLYSSIGSFQYGVWKFYDAAGNLIREIDYETPYGFTWKDVLVFAQKEEIDLNAPNTYIARVNNETDGKYWYISWNTKDRSSGKPMRTVRLDGDTGKILSDKRFEIEE